MIFFLDISVHAYARAVMTWRDHDQSSYARTLTRGSYACSVYVSWQHVYTAGNMYMGVRVARWVICCIMYISSISDKGR